MKKRLTVLSFFVVVLSLALSACSSLNGANATELKASGTIASREVNIAPQIGGMVVSVSAQEGAQVKKGDELFRLDDSLLMAQRKQASAAVSVAEAAVNTARIGQESAHIQYDIALNAARLQDQQNRATVWQAPLPEGFSLPIWYYQKAESLSAAEAEVVDAKRTLDTEQANLQRLLGSTSYKNFIDGEKRLGEAQVASLIARQILNQATAAVDKENLESYAQGQFDTAKAALDAAQSAYNGMLTSQVATDILEARGRVAVTQARYDAALDLQNQLMTGEQSLQVQAARAGVQQAEAGVTQAETMLAQAQAALATLDVQNEKTVIRAPMDGVVLIRSLEMGETVAPGGVVMVIGQLAEVELVVYIPETEYGKVQLGDQVSITVDSFPSKTFAGMVVYISNKAEFTPRNVQTVEGRRTTVYAIKLSVPNPDLKLKPGMPADVTFLTGL